MASEVIRAPWTQAQVDGLLRYQRDGRFHPYTCIDSEHGPLDPTTGGWVCQECGYAQTWALEGSIAVAAPAQPDHAAGEGYTLEDATDAIEGKASSDWPAPAAAPASEAATTMLSGVDGLIAVTNLRESLEEAVERLREVYGHRSLLDSRDQRDARVLGVLLAIAKERLAADPPAPPPADEVDPRLVCPMCHNDPARYARERRDDYAEPTCGVCDSDDRNVRGNVLALDGYSLVPCDYDWHEATPPADPPAPPPADGQGYVLWQGEVASDGVRVTADAEVQFRSYDGTEDEPEWWTPLHETSILHEVAAHLARALAAANEARERAERDAGRLWRERMDAESDLRGARERVRTLEAERDAATLREGEAKEALANMLTLHRARYRDKPGGHGSKERATDPAQRCLCYPCQAYRVLAANDARLAGGQGGEGGRHGA